MSVRASRRRSRAQRGSAVLLTVVLAPVLMLALALAVDTASVQLTRQRLRSALDQAAVVAGSVGATAGDRASLDPARTAATLRSALVDNLQPLAGALVGTDPRSIAAAADVVVVTSVPAPDPLAGGGVLRRPTVEVRVRVPIRGELLGVAGLSSTVVLTLVAAADLRMTGTTSG